MDGEALLIASSIYARLVLGGVFLWAGIAKIRHLSAFESAVASFDLLPRHLSAVAARSIPLIEMGFGALLIAGFWTRWIAAAALLLLGIFTLVTLITLIRGHRPRCLCFGSVGGEIGWWTIQRNLSLMFMGGIAAISQAPAISLDGRFDQDRVATIPIDQALLVAAVWSAGAVIWLLIVEALNYRHHR